MLWVNPFVTLSQCFVNFNYVSEVCDRWSIFYDAEFLGEGVMFCDIFLSEGAGPYWFEDVFY